MKKIFSILAVSFIIILILNSSSAVQPSGATEITVVSSQTATPQTAQSVGAQAGNVTELNIFGVSVTQTWQGYFGNVSGTIQLADANDKVMYNWSVANPEGEIYASVSNSVNWDLIDCFNWSENGAALEASYGIEPDDVDGVDETFSYEHNHDLFFTNNKQFSQGQCMSTSIFDYSGQSVDNHFQEVLLWDGTDVVFVSLLEKESVLGFDGRDHDFEMLVLENGHGTDTAVTNYYFYVELQ